MQAETTASPGPPQLWAKLPVWMHKDLCEHGCQAGQQRAGQGLFSGRGASEVRELDFPK